jgi:WD40 repeat protein
MRLFKFVFLLLCLGAGLSARAALNNLGGSIASSTFYESTLMGGNDTTTIALELQTDIDYGASVAMRAIAQGSGGPYATFGADYVFNSDFSLAYSHISNGVRFYRGRLIVRGVADTAIEPIELVNVLIYVKLATSATYMASLTIGDASPKPLITIKSNTGDPLQSSDAAEGGQTSEFILERSGVINRSTVVFLGFGGSATNGYDYDSISNTITFNLGETRKVITISPIDNAIYDGIRVVNLSVIANAGYNVAPESDSGDSVAISMNILDNELPPTPTPVPTITPIPTATPTPTPTPTPNPLQSTFIQPARIIGHYPPTRVAYSRDSNRLYLSNGPLLTMFDPASMSRVLDLNNCYYSLTAPAGSEFVQNSFDQFEVSFDRTTGLIPNGTSAMLWDLDLRYIIREFNHGEASNVYSIAYQTLTFPNLIATASQQYIRIWNASTGKVIAAMNGLNNVPIRRLVISPDGRFLFAAFDPDTSGNHISRARIYSIPTTLILKEYSFNSKDEPYVPINDAAFSPDSTKLIFGNESGRTTVVDLTVDPPNEIYRINSVSPVKTVLFSQDGTLFGTNTEYGFAFWNATNFQPTFQYDPETTITGGIIRNMALSPNNGQMAYINNFGMNVVTIPDGAMIYQEGPTKYDYARFIHNFPIVAVRNAGDTFKFFNYANGDHLFDLPDPDLRGNPKLDPVELVQDRNNQLIVTLTSDFTTTSNLNFYEGLTGVLNRSLIYQDTFNTIDLSPSGELLAVGRNSDPYLYILASDTLTTVPSNSYSSFHHDKMRALKFRTDTELMSTGDDAQVILTDPITGDYNFVFDHDLFTQEVHSLDLSVDGNELLTGSDTAVFRWDLTAAKMLQYTTGFHGPARFVPANKEKYIVSNSATDNTVQIWSKKTSEIGARYKAIVNDLGTDHNFDVSDDGVFVAMRGGKLNPPLSEEDTIWIWVTAFPPVPHSATAGWAAYE